MTGVDGTVVDPDNGKEYKGKIWAVGNDNLKMRGYIGISILGRTESWVRIPPPVPVALRFVISALRSCMRLGWEVGMIFGAHVIVYSKDAEADRAFLRDVLGIQACGCGAWMADFCVASGGGRCAPGGDEWGA